MYREDSLRLEKFMIKLRKICVTSAHNEAQRHVEFMLEFKKFHSAIGKQREDFRNHSAEYGLLLRRMVEVLGTTSICGGSCLELLFLL